MVIIDIPTNPNCDAMDMRIFHDLGAPREIRQVRLEREPGRPQWCEVTGWTTANTPCPVLVHKVDDSGEGVAFLVHGGDAGLRFRHATHPTPWGLDDPQQWGEPFLITTDAEDLQ